MSDRQAASALKMAYGSWTKGSAALLLAARATAEHFGVSAELDEESARSQPGLSKRLRAAESNAAAKGWRWTDEIRETQAPSLPPVNHRASVRRLLSSSERDRVLTTAEPRRRLASRRPRLM